MSEHTKSSNAWLPEDLLCPSCSKPVPVPLSFKSVEGWACRFCGIRLDLEFRIQVIAVSNLPSCKWCNNDPVEGDNVCQPCRERHARMSPFWGGEG